MHDSATKADDSLSTWQDLDSIQGPVILLGFLNKYLVHCVTGNGARQGERAVLGLCEAHLASLTSWQSRLDLGRSVRLAIAFAITPGFPA